MDENICIDNTLGIPLMHCIPVPAKKEEIVPPVKQCTTLIRPNSALLTAGREARNYRADFEDVAHPINSSYGDPAGGVNTPEQETQEGGRPCVLVMGNELSISLIHRG